MPHADSHALQDQKRPNRIRCEGMYSKSSWGGDVEPYIMARFDQASLSENDLSDPVVAISIFNWNDVGKIGASSTESPERLYEICDSSAVDLKLCTKEQLGSFIIDPSAGDRIVSAAVHIKEAARPVPKLSIKSTGYYCAYTQPLDDHDYRAIVEFRNAYGELPGAQVPKLAFYGALTIVYAVIGVFWGFLYFMNRSDILPVQNYITATIIFLVVEMLITWAYYDYMNRHGMNAGAKALLVVDSILNAARSSLSFFLLLIVCMGYGVVKPSLGRTMKWVRGLAITHFVFGVIYAIGSLTVKPEDAGPLVLLVVLPLAATGTAFYVWTLNSLGRTLKDLVERKQRVKAMMYRKLWWCILLSIVIIFGFFVLNVLLFSGRGSEDFTPKHWRSRWFVLDGWLSLVYLADVAFIAYIWRPTANNRRFAMSEELAQDDEGFEIASVRDSLDDMDDDDTRTAAEDGGWGKQGPPVNKAGRSNGHAEEPLPAPTPQRPPGAMRPSADNLDGETIFAVGEDGDRSSEEGDDEERQGLTKLHKDD
ncbi:MAG: hypothetical protein Q9162_000830 [Coniocarpon cinnabarinum]